MADRYSLWPVEGSVTQFPDAVLFIFFSVSPYKLRLETFTVNLPLMSPLIGKKEAKVHKGPITFAVINMI